MVLFFQDEPDEAVEPCQPVKKRSVFGDEPEEVSQKRSAKVSKTLQASVPSLFGAEPAETGGPHGSASANSSLRRPQTVHVDWTTMQLFANATFLKKTVELTKSTPSKRPYDNTKRSQNAAPAEKTSYQDIALNPARLKDLKAQPRCKCIPVCKFIKPSVYHSVHASCVHARGFS